MLAAHVLSLVVMKVCTMGSGYSTSDAELPGFTLAVPVLNIRPAADPDDASASEHGVQAAFDQVKHEADQELAKVREVYGAPLRQFLTGAHAYARWRRLLVTEGGACSQPLFLEGAELGIHLDSAVPPAIQRVMAVQIAAHLARAVPSPSPPRSRWNARATLIRELTQGLGAWPGTSVQELVLAALMRDKLQALAAEPLAAKAADKPWSEAMIADLARVKAQVLVAHLRGEVVGGSVLRAMSRFRYEDEEALFVLVAALATDTRWKAQQAKLAGAVKTELARHSPATGLHDLAKHLLDQR